MNIKRKYYQFGFTFLLTIALLTIILPVNQKALAQEETLAETPTQEPLLPEEPQPTPTEDDLEPVEPAAGVPTPLNPTGNIYVTKPTYTWSAVSDATLYRFQVLKSSVMVMDRLTSGTSATPNILLSFGAHKWRVRVYAGGVGGLECLPEF